MAIQAAVMQRTNWKLLAHLQETAEGCGMSGVDGKRERGAPVGGDPRTLYSHSAIGAEEER